MPSDREFLQGHWRIASLEVDGANVGAGLLAGASITLAGDRFVTASMGVEYAGQLLLHPDTSPKSLALRFESGPEAGNTNYGIYEVSGDGWRLCLNVSGGPAPASFATAPGSGFALESLVRASSPPASPSKPSAAPLEPIEELQGEWLMLSCLRGGEPLPPDFVRHGKRRVQGLDTTLHFGPQLFMKGHLTRDAGGAVLHHTAGQLTDATQLGIFEVDGDTLKTCFAPSGGTRPASFRSTAQGGETLSTWKRVGP